MSAVAVSQIRASARLMPLRQLVQGHLTLGSGRTMRCTSAPLFQTHPQWAGCRRDHGIRGQHIRSNRLCNRATGEGTSQENPSTSTPEPPSSYFTGMSKFCRQCGSPMEVALEDGSNWRHMCTNCDYIDYFNPKMVVGCVVEHEGKILLCKRAIEPCYGKWTIPAGFLELEESTAAGAARETWEEAAANVEIVAPYFHLDIPVIGQSYVLFRARLAAPFTFGCGPETLEAELFDPDDIPFDELAFSSVTITLKHYIEDMKNSMFHIHHGEIQKLKGSAPNDPHSFTLKNHMAFRVEDIK